MKKKGGKKWLYWLLAIFAVILVIGFSGDEEIDTSNQSDTKVEQEAKQPENKAPVITTKDQTVEYGAILAYSDLATVEDDGSGEVTLAIATSDLEGIIVDNDEQKIVFKEVGEIDLELTATDDAGKKTNKTVKVMVEDNEKPALVLSTTAFSLTAGNAAPNYMSAAKASDNVDGDLTGIIEIDSSQVNYNTAGTYEVTYTVTDSSGNVTSQTAKVTVNAKKVTTSSGSSGTSGSGNSNSSGSSGGSVLITKTGEHYHNRKCGNGNFFSATLSEAQRRGLTPCSKCY